MIRKYNNVLLISILMVVTLFGCNKSTDSSSTTTTTTTTTRYKEVSFTQITTTSDVTYGSNTTYSGATKTLKLDIFVPSNDTATNRPLLILVPGGGFSSSTDKSALTDEATAIAKYGYVVACINYRTFDGSGTISNNILKQIILQGMQDAKAAIRFFKKDALTDNVYKINPNKIFLGGHSAGAMVAAHTVYLDTISKADSTFKTIINSNGGLEGTSGNSGYSSTVVGNINLSGSLLDKNYITATSKPMLGMYGTSDALMPYNDGNFSLPSITSISVSGANSLYAQANSVGITKNVIYSITGGDHFATVQTSCTTCLSTIAGFMYALL
jgi:poly(3-hydroxybutyrate) depolymerase